MTDDPDAIGPAAAAILVDGHAPVDDMLAAIASEQRQAGRRVRGLLMRSPSQDKYCADMVLVDIHTLDEYLVSQDLGRESRACRADANGFALASQVLRKALDESPDLVICNRFGALEAQGDGFAAELLETMAQGIPVLTAVAPRHLEAWRRFSGDAPVLRAHRDDIAAWLAQALVRS